MMQACDNKRLSHPEKSSQYEPAVGKYLTIGPRCKAGIDCPCNKLKFLTSTFSSSRDDCGWDRMEVVVEPILKAELKVCVFLCVFVNEYEAGFFLSRFLKTLQNLKNLKTLQKECEIWRKKITLELRQNFFLHRIEKCLTDNLTEIQWIFCWN